MSDNYAISECARCGALFDDRTTHECRKPVEPPAQDAVEALREALDDANSLCRSAFSVCEAITKAVGPVVAQRHIGNLTNRLCVSLDRQHRVMYPETYDERLAHLREHRYPVHGCEACAEIAKVRATTRAVLQSPKGGEG